MNDPLKIIQPVIDLPEELIPADKMTRVDLPPVESEWPTSDLVEICRQKISKEEQDKIWKMWKGCKC